LLNTAWTRALLVGAAEALTPNGELILPYKRNGKPTEKSGIPARDIEEMFGKPLRYDDGIALFRPGKRPTTRMRSTLTWFLKNASSIIGQLCEYRFVETSRPQVFQELVRRTPSTYWEISDGDTSNLVADFLSESYEDLSRYLVFTIQGLNTKSLALSAIFDEIFSKKGQSLWVDLGSGSGFLGLELLLSGKWDLKVLNIDKSLAQTLVGIQALTYFEQTISSLCTMKTQNLKDTLLPPETVDAITMITTLCYVPRDEHQGILKRAWQALRSGGYLLIYENLKSKSYTRDHNLMFEEGELEILLRKLDSRIQYRHAVTGQKIAKETAHGKTCFRMLRKI